MYTGNLTGLPGKTSFSTFESSTTIVPLTTTLQGKVEAKDLTTLKTGEAIARIYTDIVKIKTAAPKPIPGNHRKEEVIRRSREKYCRKANEVRDYLRQKQNRPAIYHDWPTPTGEVTPLCYEEFE